MRNRHLFLAALVVPIFSVRVQSDEPAVPAPARLEVVNDAGTTFKFTLADLEQLSKQDVTAKDHKGEHAKYTGVLVADVLKQAEVKLGGQLRGKLLANYLLVEASDNYRVVFSLPEIDPESTDAVALLAYSRNAVPLDAAHGPFQIVVPAEKRHARWVKRVVRLTVRSDSK